MNIPEEAQVAAREAVNAWFDRVNHPALDIIGGAEVQDIARAALSAAAPTLMAKAWDEVAYFLDHEFGDGAGNFVYNNNPHRKDTP